MEIVNALAQYGIAGVILYLVARPLISYLIRTNEQKDAYIKTLVENHFKHDEERHQLLLVALKNLPRDVARVLRPRRR